MRTVGIDFASDPRNTALCEIAWESASATVVRVVRNVTDDVLRGVVNGSPPPAIGVDIPFGWPRDFVSFVSAHAHGATPASQSSMRQKRLRSTDIFIHEQFHKTPLSVSTDKIGIPALRWATLSHEFGIVNRAGDGQFFEVYPAVARVAWDLPSKDNAEALNLLLARCPLTFAPGNLPSGLLESEHTFDALLCALATRAATLGLTYLPPPDLQEIAMVEGWIHAPQPGTLARLIGVSPVSYIA